MAMETHCVELTEIAIGVVAEIKDKRIRQKIWQRIEKLAFEPEKQGEELTRELKGYFSVRVVGQRYRIVYRVEQEKVLVMVVGVGLRK